MQTEEIQIKDRVNMTPGKRQIYIVDDDESICRALKILMVTYGFTVRTFHSAEEFFSAVPNNAPGCLILDIYLPGLDGWQAQEKLLKSGSKRPVIIITTDRNGKLKDQALGTGAKGFLQKPIQDHELVCLINRAYTN